MELQSLHEVLGLAPGSSPEDIRTAFKRRALQAHPDKGGSKEAFHSLYHAFSTLLSSAGKRDRYVLMKPDAFSQSGTYQNADIECGEQNDVSIERGCGVSMPMSACSRVKRKRPVRSPLNTKPPTICTVRSGSCHADPTSIFREKLLSHIWSRLQQVSPATRKETLLQQFSEKQRLELLAWKSTRNEVVVDSEGQPTTLQGHAKVSALAKRADDSESDSEADSPSSSEISNEELSMLALCDDVCHDSHSMDAGPEAAHTKTQSGHQDLPTSRNRSNVRGISTMIYGSGYQTYRVNISIENLSLFAKDVNDLHVALEVLVILVGVKHHVLENHTASLGHRLRQALHDCLHECGKSVQDLGLTFVVTCRQSFWVGRRPLSTPRLPSVDDAIRVWEELSPYFMLRGTGRNHPIWHVGPHQLRERWIRFRESFVKISEHFGTSKERTLEYLQQMEDANSHRRENVLQYWECQHMRMEDGRRGYRGRSQLSQSVKDERCLQKIHHLLSRWQLHENRRTKLARKEARILAQKRRYEIVKWRRERRRMAPHLTMDDLMGHAHHDGRASGQTSVL